MIALDPANDIRWRTKRVVLNRDRKIRRGERPVDNEIECRPHEPPRPGNAAITLDDVHPDHVSRHASFENRSFPNRRSRTLSNSPWFVMRLPGANKARVDPSKVRDYLLSRQHPFGRSKAAIFEWIGYRQSDWRRLQRDLVEAATANTARLQKETEHGSVYEIHVMLKGPGGRVASITTIWIVRTGEDFPRFVTAFPGE